VVERRSASKPIVKKLFTWALANGRRHREEILRGATPTSLSWRLANRLVLKKVTQQAFGGQVRDFISGGAPLGVDTAGWFADFGIRIFEGYGLTETSPVVALNNAQNHRIGSVGKPIESVEYKFALDGELLVERPIRLRRLLAQTGRHPRSHRTRGLVPTPVTSGGSTTMVFCTSQTARRSCSRPPAER